jgi:RHS repeat-associated protein
LTGLDYADQRFYASTYGRFNTADPYQASGGPGDPASWNRYSYTRGDPINRHDPRGLMDCEAYYTYLVDTLGYLPADAMLEAFQGCQSPCTGTDSVVMAYLDSVGQGCGSGGIQSPSETVAPTPQCPLISLVGKYKTTAGVVALFAPDLAYKVDAALKVLNDEGIVPVITDGFRTLADQQSRYDNWINGNSTFPAAKPGTGVHEIGEAIDFGLNANGAINSAQIEEALAGVAGQGLTWGGTWKGRQYDPVHFENVHSPSTSQLAACEKEHP